MICQTCGGELKPLVTDLPFKVNERTIVVLRALPVIQCDNCREFSIEDRIMERVEAILDRTGPDAELEIVSFAA